MVVWKFPVSHGHNTILVPSKMGRVVLVGPDVGGVPCLWIEVDPEAYQFAVPVEVVGTGQTIPEGSIHLGSFVDGDCVWHAYSDTLGK